MGHFFFSFSQRRCYGFGTKREYEGKRQVIVESLSAAMRRNPVMLGRPMSKNIVTALNVWSEQNMEAVVARGASRD